MKYKTSELTGTLLDSAFLNACERSGLPFGDDIPSDGGLIPSAVFNMIIEDWRGSTTQSGTTPSEAYKRVIVAHYLGDEVAP